MIRRENLDSKQHGPKSPVRRNGEDFQPAAEILDENVAIETFDHDNMDISPAAPRYRRTFHSVAIVGRPNVGKSTLFNRLVGRRMAITDPTAGTTRDRLLYPVEHDGLLFDLIDTGGLGIIDNQDLSEHVEEQIQRALTTASVLLFMADSREGLTSFDEQIAGILRRLNIPVIFAVNKVENDRLTIVATTDFARLGFDTIFPISAKQGFGIADLMDEIVRILESLPTQHADHDDLGPDVMKVTIVGRRNVGKSSLLNCLAGETRMIVSDVAGTTRDAVDVVMTHHDRPFIMVDTAGIHKMKKIHSSIEFFAQVRTERAIERTDVVVLMLDASQPPGLMDRRIAESAAGQFKPCVVAVNKWDLVAGKMDTKDFIRYLGDSLPSIREAPIVFTNSMEARNIRKVIDTAFDLYDRSNKRISTGELNRAMARLLEGQEPPRGDRGRKPRLYFMTQVGVRPPTVVVSCSHPDQIGMQYRRYLARKLRKLLGMNGIPVRVFLRNHRDPGTAKKSRK